MSYMNKLPKESHDTDFSRIKPWYLDGQYVAYTLSLFLILTIYQRCIPPSIDITVSI